MLLWLLWGSAFLQRDLAQAQQERDRGRIERLLQRAPASRVAFAAVPESSRAVCGADGVPVHGDVVWLVPQASALERDDVVDDRLDRATHAEFAGGDAAAAERAFDAVLAVALVTTVRLRVLAAAAWQARRAQANGREATLRRELDEHLAQQAPADLARRAVADVVASALRLAAADTPPAWADRLVPLLPPEVFATLPDASPWAAAHARIVARRALLTTLAAALRDVPAGALAGLRAVDAARLVWWQPRDDGGRDAALLTPAAFAAAVEAAGVHGELPELSWPAHELVAASTNEAFGGVPGLHDAAFHRPVPVQWRTPALTGALVAALAVALGFAVAAQLRAARAEMQAVRTQSQFLTTVTHELKTPLAAIRLLGEMLVDGRARGREDDYYRMLAGEAGRLSLLIENVLDLGRLERGERAYDLRLVAVADVVGETLAMFAPLVASAGGEVRWHDEAAGAVVRVDRGAMVQALVAVLDNARKYAAACGPVDVTARRVDGQLELSVRDRGPGVPAGERDRIFDRFVRGAAQAHGSTPGVGIGLYLARTIVQRLGGTLTCGDPLDGGPGACFTLRLPLEPAP